MLRHFKMELKRQQELELTMSGTTAPSSNQTSTPAGGLSTGSLATSSNQNIIRPLATTGDNQPVEMKRKRDVGCANGAAGQEQQQVQKQPKRVRGRRSSKPAMEKRRRARINECLDILKSYVLTDSSQLNKLGIDLAASENQLDEESIARQILKNSGLINRHRGRKNPNKLEKADILELTVDYVRRLHEQRDELLMSQTASSLNQQHQHQQLVAQSKQQRLQQQSLNVSQYNEQVPAHLSEPLTLDLSPKWRQVNTSTTPPALQAAYCPPPNTPLTPPSSNGSSSSSSSSSCSLASELTTANPIQQHNQATQMQLLSQVLDARYKPLYSWSMSSLQRSQ